MGFWNLLVSSFAFWIIVRSHGKLERYKKALWIWSISPSKFSKELLSRKTAIKWYTWHNATCWLAWVSLCWQSGAQSCNLVHSIECWSAFWICFKIKSTSKCLVIIIFDGFPVIDKFFDPSSFPFFRQSKNFGGWSSTFREKWGRTSEQKAGCLLDRHFGNCKN